MTELQLLRTAINDAIRELAARGLQELDVLPRSEEAREDWSIDTVKIRRDLEQADPGNLLPPSVAAVASKVGGSEVFRMAISRVRAVFRLNFVVSATLIAIFVASLVSTVICAFATGDHWWSIVFGGITIVDIAGLLVVNPLRRLDRAMVVSNMLEILHVRYLDLTRSCEEIKELSASMECLRAAWTELRTEMEKIMETL